MSTETLIPYLREQYRVMRCSTDPSEAHIESVIADDLNFANLLGSFADSILDAATLAGCQVKPPARILEVGGGTARLSMIFAKKGFLVTAIEPCTRHLDIARKLVAHHQIPLENLELVHGTGEQLPFPDAQFDLVVSCEVIEHCQSPTSFLSECIRVLKPEKGLYLTAPDYLTFWEGHYQLPWLPLLPKPIARVYVRALGRSVDGVNEFQYVTNSRIRTMLESMPVRIFDVRRWVFVDRVKRFGRGELDYKFGNLAPLVRAFPRTLRTSLFACVLHLRELLRCLTLNEIRLFVRKTT